jgi:hypothetical protein
MNKRLIFAVVVFLILAVLSGCAVRERIAINTSTDSYIWGGADVIFYSDDHATQKLRLFGDSGAVNATGNITVTGSGSVGAAWTVGTFGLYTISPAKAVITVTHLGYITPTYTYQQLHAAGNVWTSNLAALGAGTLVVLANKSNTTITITDTGIIMLSADWAGTQYDTLTLLSDGTNWLELARSNN